MHQQLLEKERRKILSERSVRELIQSRVQTIGLLASQTDKVTVIAEEYLKSITRTESMKTLSEEIVCEVLSRVGFEPEKHSQYANCVLAVQKKLNFGFKIAEQSFMRKLTIGDITLSLLFVSLIAVICLDVFLRVAK